MNEPDGQALERKSYELSILNDVARSLNASVDLPTLLGQALEKVAELLGLSTGWVLLFDETSGEPYLAAARNLPPGFHQEPALLTGWCHCLESFRAGDLSGAANIGVMTCSRLKKLAPAPGAGLRFHASVPLEVFAGEAPGESAGAEGLEGGRKRLGMLNVAGPEWRRLDDGELGLLRTVGDVLGVAVERARLHARRLEAVQIEERNRLAREIHDTVAQDLAALSFQLEAAEALLEAGAERERIRQNVAAALDLARQGLAEVRRSVLDLRAAPLAGRTLAAALAALAAEADAAAVPGGPRVAFAAAGATPPLPPAVEVGLYRIAQEALQNALRHAAAGSVTLCLEALPGRVRLTVEDDGRGLADGAVPERAGRFGLVGMRERAHLAGGSFRIESEPGAGTRITAEIPLAGRI